MQSSSRIVKVGQAEITAPFQVSSLDELTTSPTYSARTSFEPGNLADLMVQSDQTSVRTESAPIVDKPVGLSRNGNHSSILQKQNIPNNPQVWTFPDLSGKSSHQNSRSVVPQKVADYSYILDDAKVRADEIIAEADKNATMIVEQAQIEAESIKQKAFMEGMTTARNEVSQTMHQVERVIQETQVWQEQVMHKSQRKIIDMVMAIGRKLFGNGFEMPPEQIDHIVSRAINEASRLGNLRIYLHPEDAKMLVNLWQESELTLNGQQIQIVSSQNISRGGCFVDGQFGIVDGRVEEQVDQIMNSVRSTEVDQIDETDEEEEGKE